MKNLSFETIDLTFDKDLNPIIKNEQQQADYDFLKSIFSNSNIMKTSSMLACKPAENKHDLHKLMSILVEQDKKYQQKYGIKKVFHTIKKTYIGIGGAVRHCKKINNFNVIEGFVFLIPEHQGFGYAYWIYKHIVEESLKNSEILISSAWNKNIASCRIIEKFGLELFETKNKSFNNNEIIINEYIRYPNSQKYTTLDSSFCLSGQLQN